MSALVAAVAQKVCERCHSKRCRKKGCSVSLQGVSAKRLVVDLDCTALQIPANQKHCDYLFVGEEGSTTWVVPIELKSGGFKVSEVVGQLQGGTRLADEWLPPESPFQFVPALAYRKGVRKNVLEKLHLKKFNLRGQERKAMLLRCGEDLGKILLRP